MNLKHIETKADYEEYDRRVAAFLKDNYVKAGLHSPVDADGSSFFSWMACECCKRPLGGNRERYRFVVTPPIWRHAFPKQIETMEADICTDCVYYLVFGKLDDMTMLDLTDTDDDERSNGPKHRKEGA